MHGLIGALGADLGVERAAAEKAASIVLPLRRLEDAADGAAALQINQTLPVIRSAAESGASRRSTHDRTAMVHTREETGKDAAGDPVGAMTGRLV